MNKSLIDILCITGMVIMAIMAFVLVPVYASSGWLSGVDLCTDIWQQTQNETLYYDCIHPLDSAMME